MHAHLSELARDDAAAAGAQRLRRVRQHSRQRVRRHEDQQRGPHTCRSELAAQALQLLSRDLRFDSY